MLGDAKTIDDSSRMRVVHKTAGTRQLHVVGSVYNDRDTVSQACMSAEGHTLK